MTVKAKATVKATEKPKDKEQTAEELINGLIDKSEKLLINCAHLAKNRLTKFAKTLHWPLKNIIWIWLFQPLKKLVVG